MSMLKEYKKQQSEARLLLGDKWHKTESVFTQSDGKPMHPATMSGWFPSFLSRHKLPHMNFHGLRHTCSSLLIADGATAVDLAKRLGHITPSTTLNIYSHAFQKSDEKLAGKMADILANVTRKKA
jgi:integrase